MNYNTIFILFVVLLITNPLLLSARKVWGGATGAYNLEIEANDRALIKSAAVLENTYTTSNGIFSIYYTLTGADAVPDSDCVTMTDRTFHDGANGIPDYVEYIAFACDSAYSFLVTQSGYLYSRMHVGVEVNNLGNIYSYAMSIDSLCIDNDMAFLKGIGEDVREGVFVSIAHEFYHMVQFGYTYGFNFFNEPSAIWMEDKLFPDVNDYLQYLDSTVSYSYPEHNMLLEPEYPLDAYNAAMPGNYDKVLWPMFLDQRFSSEVNKNAWELYGEGQTATIAVFDSALRRFNDTLGFQKAFTEFGEWLFYTDGRAPLKPGFNDAALLQSVRIDTFSVISIVAGSRTLLPLSLQYFKLTGYLANQDTIFALRSSDADSGAYVYYIGITNGGIVEDTLAALEPGFVRPINGADEYFICLINPTQKTCGIEMNSVQVHTERDIQKTNIEGLCIYPNPFNPSTTISYDIPSNDQATLAIFTLTGKLLCQQQVSGKGNHLWDASILPSGVYVCRVNTGRKTFAKMMILIR